MTVEYVFNLAAIVLIASTISAAILLEENKGKSDVTIVQNLIEGTNIVLSRKIVINVKRKVYLKIEKK